MRNSEKIKKTTTTAAITTTTEILTTTKASVSQEITTIIYEYRTAFYSLLVIVLLAILGFVGYKWFVSGASST